MVTFLVKNDFESFHKFMFPYLMKAGMQKLVTIAVEAYTEFETVYNGYFNVLVLADEEQLETYNLIYSAIPKGVEILAKFPVSAEQCHHPVYTERPYKVDPITDISEESLVESDKLFLSTIFQNRTVTLNIFNNIAQVVYDNGGFTLSGINIGDTASLTPLDILSIVLSGDFKESAQRINPVLHEASDYINTNVSSFAELCALTMERAEQLIQRRQNLLDAVLSMTFEQVDKLSPEMRQIINANGAYLSLTDVQRILKEG